MKDIQNNGTPTHKTFSFGRGVVPYIFLLIFAVIFTQALRSPISVVFLWFVGTLPILSFFYALIGRANVGAFVLSDETTVEKLTPVGYEFRVSNYSILPMPFTEAEIILPTDNGVSCASRLVGMSILPRGEYHFKSDVTFRYRGAYRVGVGCVYVSDFLRIFRLRRRVDVYSKIYVMPRRVLFPREDDHSPSDTPTDGRMTEGNESSETNLIREYRGGDPLKHIHWKLSSKMQDLMVNDYKPNAGKNVYIFCDFATLFRDTGDTRERREQAKKTTKTKKKQPIRVRLPRRDRSGDLTTDERIDAMAEAAQDRAEAARAVEKARRELFGGGKTDSAASDDEVETESIDAKVDDQTKYLRATEVLPEMIGDFDAYCADGVSELAVGVILHELERGNLVSLLWFDERADNGFFCYSVSSNSDIDSFFRHFGTAPVCPYDRRVSLLPMLLDDTDSPTFIYVTASAGIAELDGYMTASRGAGAERTDVLLFDPRDRFKDRKLHDEYIDMCRVRYAENKINLVAIEPSWETE